MRSSVAISLLVAYLTLLFYLTIVAFSVQNPHPDALLNPVPFETVAHDLQVGGRRVVINLLGNLAAFLPLGVFVPILRGSWATASRVAILSMVLSTLIETLQYGSGRRVADVDDIILNTLGGVLGYAVFVGLRRWRSRGPILPPGP